MGRVKAQLELWELAQKGGELALRCRKCGHQACVSAKKLIERPGTRIIGLIPFRCSVCACTDIERRPVVLASI